jgi:hypothetical protein
LIACSFSSFLPFQFSLSFPCIPATTIIVDPGCCYFGPPPATVTCCNPPIYGTLDFCTMRVCTSGLLTVAIRMLELWCGVCLLGPRRVSGPVVWF